MGTERSSYDAPPRHFVPDELDVGEWSAVRPLFEELEKRSIESVEDFEKWLLEISELEAVLSAEEARRYIDMSRHTDDDARREKYIRFSREIEPQAKSAIDRLDRLYLQSPFRSELPRPRFEVFDRIKASDAEIFCEENLPLESEETEVATSYTQLMGSLTIELDGEVVPLAKAALELEEPERERREAAWRKIAGRRLEVRDRVHEDFLHLLRLRRRMAANAGLPDYRALRFRKLRRFDYGVAECELFHRSVSEVVVPATRRFDEARRSWLGVDILRPWDFEVRLFFSESFRPFRTEAELCEITRAVFQAVEPDFATEFAILEERGLLDLFSRPNKAPGGYQYFLEDVRMPFVFANAAGTHEDVQTLLHEGGHSFHSLACRGEPITLYRDPPLEFCEVASMGMEFLGLERLETIYPPETARRVRCSHLERTVRLLSWIATIDAFQHWIYTASESDDREALHAKWLELSTRFSPDVDWSGLEEYRAVQWHRQGHIFRQPFYYIEYGIALIGALQIWSRFRRQPEETVAEYRRALALGGTRSLRELFDRAGLRFEFAPELVDELVSEVRVVWEELAEAV